MNPGTSATHYIGDCRTILRRLPDASVQACVTSPPYWGLRDYGTATWDGGDPSCDHMESKPSRTASSIASSTLVGSKDTVHASHVYRGDCGRCGARRVDRQIGLEPTPDLYVAALVDVFREVRRALRDDGTLWLNLGDSYASGGMSNPSSKLTLDGGKDRGASGYSISRAIPHGLKPKDLVGVPWMVAFALRTDGWWLRQDIIWAKPNPMPESVADRCTKAHEYLFLLSKSERYYFDAAAIAEPEAATSKRLHKYDKASRDRPRNGAGDLGGEPWRMGGAKNGLRNRRSVWTVASQPYAGAHFATFPPKLIEPCILAGSRPGDIVLDPFFGSGTTGIVAERHGRRWIGIDLGYGELARERITKARI